MIHGLLLHHNLVRSLTTVIDIVVVDVVIVDDVGDIASDLLDVRIPL